MYKLTLLLCVLCFLFSCTGTNHNEEMRRWAAQKGKLKVLATTAMIEDIVSHVGKEHVDCITLIKGDLDPHSYQPVKGDDEKFILADLIFYNGLGLEHGPSWQHYLSQAEKAIGLGNKLQGQFPALILYDDCGQSDPHIWTDIGLFAKSIPYIVEALSARDPLHAKEYDENGKELFKLLVECNDRMREVMQGVPEHLRYLVTSHDAFNYFSRAYLSTPEERVSERWHKRFSAPEGLAPDSQLSATDIQDIVAHLKKYQVHVIFPESNVSQDSINKIVSAGKEMGLELKIADTPLYGDAMGPQGSHGDTYLKMIEHNVRTISNYLMGQEEKIADSHQGQRPDSQL